VVRNPQVLPPARIPFPQAALGKGVTAESTSELIATVDELLLAEVIEAGGFRPAQGQTRLTKSRLSRRVAALEARLQVCLLTRNSRRFEVTEIGRRLYEQALQIRAAARTALTLADDSRGAPSGVLRVACPLALSQTVVCRLAIAFVQAHPGVRLCLSTTKGTLEALSEHYDLVIHPSTQPLPDSEVVARLLMTQPYRVVAAPALAGERAGVAGPAAFNGLCAVGWNSGDATATWRLFGPNGAEAQVQLPVAFAADNLLAVREAALAGLGVALLPEATCREDVRSGRLCELAPGWAPAPMALYVLYPSRRRPATLRQSASPAVCLDDCVQGPCIPAVAATSARGRSLTIADNGGGAMAAGPLARTGGTVGGLGLAPAAT
jgi:DNA-binding transcriptional LysR family regulator